MSLHLITSILIPHFWSWYISAFFLFETIQFCVLFCRNFNIRILNCKYNREIIHEIDWNFEQVLFHESITHLFISKRIFFRIFSNDEVWKKKKNSRNDNFRNRKKNLIFHDISFFFFRFSFFVFFFSAFFELQIRLWIFSDIVISVF